MSTMEEAIDKLAAHSTDENLSLEQAEAKLNAIPNLPERKKQSMLSDIALSIEIRKFILASADAAKTEGATLTWQSLQAGIDEICARHGHMNGLPLPRLENDSHQLHMAEGGPLSWMMNLPVQRTELAEEISNRNSKLRVRNSWTKHGDGQVCILDTPEGIDFIEEPAAGTRLRKLMTDMKLRNDAVNLSAEAELKAIESLKTRVTPNQYRLYVLNGFFPERSKRSDLHYFFRKGRPTLVSSYHGDNRENGGKIIAALCFHPMGYYLNSHVGVMTPTDEVIAALVCMRGDEHALWKKSGQWHPADSRCGL